MATNFPSSLDSFTNPTAVDTLDSPPHDTQHADANDAIEALQAKVGADGSAVTTSLDYKVANLESRPVETKTASYTLVAGDVNKRIVMNNAGATTITVDDGVFAAGDTVWIHNIGAGTTTVTAGTATVDTAGSLDVGQWEGGSLYFTSASSAIFFRGGGAGVAYGAATGGTSSTITVGGESYTLLRFTSSSTLTVTKAGVFDVLVVGGGGGGGTSGTLSAGGGGAGGYREYEKIYFDTNQTVTIGAGGAVNGTRGTHSRCGQPFAAGGGTMKGYELPRQGASGAGGGYYTTPAVGDGVSGNNGGNGGLYNSGGGGGAGAAGGAGSGGVGGAGGAGKDASAFRGEAATTTYYAGGGGGEPNSNGSGGSGGLGGVGGGGNGKINGVRSATAGAANTGGGGGADGRAGGSGIVLVRFKN
jgi:hypothetical protein